MVRHCCPVPRLRTLAGAAYGTLALVDTVLAAGPARWHRARRLTKPLLMPTLAIRQATGPSGPDLRTLAQAFSWGGDVALLEEDRDRFLAGTGSFLVAHLAYIAAYRRRSSQPVLATRGRRRMLAVLAVTSSGMGLAAARRDRALGLPVAVYGATLATMVTAAAAVDPDRGRGRMLAGAATFMLSDTLLGVRMFVLATDDPRLEGAVMATYTAAQWQLSSAL